MNKMTKLKILRNGVIKNNPVFKLALGTCPILAVTTSAFAGLAMGLAVLTVVIYSNVMISLLRKVIPDNIRIAAYVLIIATFVTVLEMLISAYMPALYTALGIFLPLIVVNCILLARAEAFAADNNVLDSAIDGLSMGIGYTLSLTLMGMIREVLGSGKFFGLDLGFPGLEFFILPAGGFLMFGILMAAFVAAERYYKDRKRAALYNAKLKGGR